jgi:hypothetical protein
MAFSSYSNGMGGDFGQSHQRGRPERPQKIEIKEANNGFIVQAGCQQFVFATHKSLLKALDLFYTDYDAAYKKYMKKG